MKVTTRINGFAALVLAIMMIFIKITGGFAVNILSVNISVHHIAPIIIIMGLRGFEWVNFSI